MPYLVILETAANGAPYILSVNSMAEASAASEAAFACGEGEISIKKVQPASDASCKCALKAESNR